MGILPLGMDIRAANHPLHPPTSMPHDLERGVHSRLFAAAEFELPSDEFEATQNSTPSTQASSSAPAPAAPALVPSAVELKPEYYLPVGIVGSVFMGVIVLLASTSERRVADNIINAVIPGNMLSFGMYAVGVYKKDEDLRQAGTTLIASFGAMIFAAILIGGSMTKPLGGGAEGPSTVMPPPMPTTNTTAVPRL